MHPLNPMRDEPKKSSTHRIALLMQETKDWRNLPSLLIGLRNSRRPMKRAPLEKMVRNACEHGYEGVIMECLRQTDKTGVVLCHLRLAHTLMLRAVYRAIEGDWTEAALNKGLDLADSLWIMMHDPKHESPNGSSENPTQSPQIVGVMLQLHAAKAVMLQARQDTQGKVVEYTQRLLALWGKLDFSFDPDPPHGADKLLEWIPIWHGMKMAQKISGMTIKMRDELGIRIKEIETAIDNALNIIRQSQGDAGFRRGLKLYENISSVSS